MSTKPSDCRSFDTLSGVPNCRTRRNFLKYCSTAIGGTLTASVSTAATTRSNRLVRFGKTDLYVTRYCQGTAFRQVPRDDRPEGRAILHRCLDVGINFFDSAEAYGRGGSETVLGRAIRGRRDEVVLCTKAAPSSATIQDPDPNKFKLGGPITFSEEILFNKLEGSLKRLGTDYVDLYLFHDWDGTTPAEQLAEWMDKLVQSGKTRYWGVSNFSAQQVTRFCEIADTQSGQSSIAGTEDYFHIAVGERQDPDLFKVIRRNNLGMLAFSPQNEGQLSPGREDKLGKAKTPVVRALDKVARELGATRPQVCIAWVLAHPEVTSVLGGAESPEHVEENFGGTQLELPPEALATLNAVSKTYLQHRLQRIQQVQAEGAQTSN